MTALHAVVRSPTVKLVLYYAGVLLVAIPAVRVFPFIASAFQPVVSPAGFADLAGLGPPAEGQTGFLGLSFPALRATLAVVGALVLTAPIAWVYMVTKREVRYDQSLVHTLVMLPVAVTGIVIIVQDSLALAFSLAGIVAAVRFRNTLQDTKDAVYIFLAIVIGLAAGIQVLPVALVISALFNLVVLGLWQFDVGDIYAPERRVSPATTGEFAAVPSRKRGSKMIDVRGLGMAPAAVAEQAPVINPELSLLEFVSRVLSLAEDPRVPLLARVRFLGIVSTNLDEFFMVKVGGLKQGIAEGITKRSIDGQLPRDLLNACAVRLRALVRRQYRCFHALFQDGLGPQGIRLRSWSELDDPERAYLQDYFDERVFPILTPKAITLAPGHPFPYLEDLLLSIAMVVRDPRTSRDHFVQLKIVDALPRFIQLPDSHDFVLLEEVLRANMQKLYPGREVLEMHPFRITRSSELQLDEKNATNFLETLEDGVRRRADGAVVRIEVERSMPFAIRDLLLSELRQEETGHGIRLEASDIFEVDGMVDLGALSEIAATPMPELDYPAFTPAQAIPADRSVFEVLDERDVLLHHPYDDFESSVQRFLAEAADDPNVVSIKLTLYRPGGPSGVTDALLRAALVGKDVSVFVEVKARFDEELNIYWAKQLERGGIHVVTGLVKLKTHAKIALVVRRRGDGLRRYGHVGTGNYNALTARQYTDLGLLTSDQQICSDLGHVFNELTGSSRPPAGEFPRLLVAPTNMLRRFLHLIDREAEHARAGRRARIRAKLNGIADTELIEALYRAAQAGVRIDLVVRGICAVRPGMPGISDGIRVVAAVGRFLEHGRIVAFANGGTPEYYIGSADWRSRNLRRRMEVATPVLDAACQARLDAILERELADPTAWQLQSDGSYAEGIVAADATSAQDQFRREAETGSA